MTPAEIRSMVMFSDMPVACLDVGRRNQRDRHRRRDGKCQKPDRVWSHESLPIFGDALFAHPLGGLRFITCRPRSRSFDRDRR